MSVCVRVGLWLIEANIYTEAAWFSNCILEPMVVQKLDDGLIDLLGLFHRRDVARIMNMFAGRVWNAVF